MAPKFPHHHPLPARALQALRLEAGFGSAAAAAEHNAWPVSRYKSHESGARPILGHDAKRYASAFGVKEFDILSPDVAAVEWRLRRAEGKIGKLRHSAARRLVCARILAGHATAAAAARACDLTASTYQKHETGAHALSSTSIELYCELFGVSPQWLLSGELPSGMGADIDGRIENVLADPVAFLGLRAPRRPTDEQKIRMLKAAVSPGRPGVSTQGIFEYDGKDVEGARGHLEKLPHRTWSLPLTFFTDQGLDPRRLFIVAVSKSGAGLVAGERLFIAKEFANSERAPFLIFARGKLSLSNEPGSAGILGAVLWRLKPAEGPEGRPSS